MADLLDLLSDRVLLCDGAIGSRVQAHDLDVDKDFWGKENCTEVLIRSRPDVVRDIHAGYLAAGADVIQTNSFGGSPLTLGEFDLAADAYDLNRQAAELAGEAVAAVAGDGTDRFVLGSVGPGTRLPSLGHIDYASLEDAFAVQCAGLVAGGVDGLLIETCQDPLQTKAAVNGGKRAIDAAGRGLPIIVQVTVEATGTLLVGTDIAAAATVVRSLDVAMMGINCATGPQEMAEHVAWLGRNWPGPISVQPNAGLPELIDGRPVYPLRPDQLCQWLERFIEDHGIAMIGGCCGTTTDHIAALDAMLRGRAGGARRPARKPRNVHWVPSLASLYGRVTLRQERAYLSIGERCNANGSKRFRELQERQDWDGCVEVGRVQVKEGSHALDVCTAFVGRDEKAEIVELVSRLRGAVTAPLVVDSTEQAVLEAALQLYGGKPVINSINFEDGEAPAAQRLALAKRFGAAVIALTIDENGMAKQVAQKLEVAKRLYEFAVGRHRLEPSDLLIDPLTFTICTGNEDDRKLGLWTLQAIRRLAAELPECQIVLGLSNISFGLKPAARRVLNSVFLDHALKHGMTGAILHLGGILPLHKIPQAEVESAEDLIYDRRRDGHDPLHAFIGLYQDRGAEAAAELARPAKVEERLKQRIIDGDRIDLEADLEEALKRYQPLEIVNTFLLDGMKVVGELFGAGKMQLPFVLQSAETMKAAVAFLEPRMDRVAGREKGTVVLATVRGDVHDIGKNLVDIILTNNGYKVVNLGIKQPIANILAAAEEHGADAIGMSGLLVKSTVVMRENLEEMSRQGIKLPVLLGGAALTRGYVEQDCRAAYDCGRLAYARDAFDGLDLMAKVVDDKFDAHVAARARKQTARPARRRREKPADAAPTDPGWACRRRAELGRDVTVPAPPFWGPRVIEQVPVKALLPYLNERMLYQFHWGYRKDGRTLDAYMDWAREELRPTLDRLVDTAVADDILLPQASYGYWKAAAEGDALILFAEDGAREVARFDLPRQRDGERKCVADYLRDASAGSERRDVIGLQVVTMGQRAADVAREWFADDRYQDYVFLHGLGVEMTEAAAEYVHRRIRAELDLANDDARDREALLRQGYRGSRYSFGYPACPRLEDQAQILALLDAGRIGVALSDEFQLHPEQSTSALVLHHPAAKYFSV